MIDFDYAMSTTVNKYNLNYHEFRRLILESIITEGLNTIMLELKVIKGKKFNIHCKVI